VIPVGPRRSISRLNRHDSDAGIASAINNAVTRVAGLIGVSAIGAAIAGELPDGTFGHNSASVAAFHDAIVICGVLVAAGGLVGLLGIVDKKGKLAAVGCAGGQLVGAPAAAARS
jgi:hypothetical protein